MIGEPFIKHLEGDIWELRPLRDRILFAAWLDDGFILLHHFVKKTQKTIDARKKQGISQKKLEELSGVKQPVIARMETGKTAPQLDTVLKILASLGKTLAVVPLDSHVK